MKEADSTRGRAAAVSRSFTVPATANRPMSPPGKNRGSTTKESVVKASRWEPNRTVALSSPTRSGSPYRARKTSSMRAAISRPPAPWLKRIRDMKNKSFQKGGGGLVNCWGRKGEKGKRRKG